jgi:hypothetical protein
MHVHGGFTIVLDCRGVRDNEIGVDMAGSAGGGAETLERS